MKHWLSRKTVEHFDQFVLCIRFDVETDHKTLVTLLASVELDIIPHAQPLRMRLTPYEYRALYVPGNLLATADTLSRASLQAT